jgi:ketosteroid isomerase-like protein
MMRHTLLIGLACVALAGCERPLTPQQRAVAEQALRDRVTGWARTFSNRERDSLASYYEQTPEFTFAWPAGQRTNGWADESKHQQDFFTAVTQTNLVLQDLKVEVLTGSVALVTFRHSADFIVGGSGANPSRHYFTGSGTMVWVRADPKAPWLLHAGQVSETPPVQEPIAPGRRRG